MVYGFDDGGPAADTAGEFAAWLAQEGAGRVHVELEVSGPQALALAAVAVREGRRRGVGGSVLRALCSFADRNGVEITLIAFADTADGRGALPQPELEAWYRRHGFVAEKRRYGGAVEMVRKPGGRGASVCRGAC